MDNQLLKTLQRTLWIVYFVVISLFLSMMAYSITPPLEKSDIIGRTDGQPVTSQPNTKPQYLELYNVIRADEIESSPRRNSDIRPRRNSDISIMSRPIWSRVSRWWTGCNVSHLRCCWYTCGTGCFIGAIAVGCNVAHDCVCLVCCQKALFKPVSYIASSSGGFGFGSITGAITAFYTSLLPDTRSEADRADIDRRESVLVRQDMRRSDAPEIREAADPVTQSSERHPTANPVNAEKSQENSIDPSKLPENPSLSENHSLSCMTCYEDSETLCIHRCKDNNICSSSRICPPCFDKLEPKKCIICQSPVSLTNDIKQTDNHD